LLCFEDATQQPHQVIIQSNVKVIAQQGILSGEQVSKKLQPFAGARGVLDHPHLTTAEGGNNGLLHDSGYYKVILENHC